MAESGQIPARASGSTADVMDGRARADCPRADSSGDSWQAATGTSRRRWRSCLCEYELHPRRNAGGVAAPNPPREQLHGNEPIQHGLLPTLPGALAREGGTRIGAGCGSPRRPLEKAWVRGRSRADLGVTWAGVPTEVASHADFKARGVWRFEFQANRTCRRSSSPDLRTSAAVGQPVRCAHALCGARAVE